MLRFNSNLTTMYGKLPILEALESAKADGFDAVECRTPFGEPREVVRDALARLGMTMVQFNCPMGDFAAGDRGIACIPGREEEFRASIAKTIDYAGALNVRQVNCVAGLMAPNADLVAVEDTLVANLKYAAPRLADAGVRLQIEPINPIDNPGVFLSTADRYARVAERVAHDNLYLQYDFYHLQIVQGDLMRNFDKYAARINHVQIADNPGRHEPGTGEINYKYILSELDRRNYKGWVGLEYVPKAAVADGLGWLREYLATTPAT